MNGFLGSLLQLPITWVLFALGLMVGSFLNVCIFRIPDKTFWKHHRSVCRHCGAQIPFYLNIPLLGYLLLWGRTRCCRQLLSPQYPIVELLTGLVFVAVYWQIPFLETYSDGLRIDHPDLIRYLHATIFSCVMIVCSVIDFRLMIIPDMISLPMVALSPMVVWLHPDLTMHSSLVGIVLGGGSLYGIAWLYWLVRREVGLGMGDVKLLAGIGGWLGYESVLPTIFLGSTLGAVIGMTAIVALKRLTLKSALPFGPFLAIGAWMHLLYGGQISRIFSEFMVIGG